MMMMELMMSNDAKQEAAKTKVVTGKVRLSYANVWTPRAGPDEGSALKYSTAILIPKTDKETIEKINRACAVVKENGKATWGGKLPPQLKMPLRDGDVDRADDPVYKGCWFLNASSNEKPGIVDRQMNEIFDKDEVYSGVFARVSLNFYAFNKNGNKGIGAGLQNIQKVADGPRLSGRTSATEDFEEIADDDDFLS